MDPELQPMAYLPFYTLKQGKEQSGAGQTQYFLQYMNQTAS